MNKLHRYDFRDDIGLRAATPAEHGDYINYNDLALAFKARLQELRIEPARARVVQELGRDLGLPL
jgi:hypothetical protein